MDPNVLHNLNYGMYIVASCRGGSLNAQIANCVFQITSNPVTVAVSISKQNLTHQYIAASRIFSVSVLSEDAPMPFIGKFGFRSGRNEDKFKDTKFKKLASGCPVVLDNTLGYLEAKVINSFDCVTHTLFMGEVVASEIIREGTAMTYAYYHLVRHGKTPKVAPTFIEKEESQNAREA